MADYSQFYEWLDSHDALECGTGMATLVSTRKRDQMIVEIQGVLDGASRARVYLICKQPDGRVGGKFVAGGRKAAPWAGFAVHASTELDEA
jgi:hypothetical protein